MEEVPPCLLRIAVVVKEEGQRDEGRAEATRDGAGSGGTRDAAHEHDGGSGRGGRGGGVPDDPVRLARDCDGVAPRRAQPSRHLGARCARGRPLSGCRHLACPQSQYHVSQWYGTKILMAFGLCFWRLGLGVKPKPLLGFSRVCAEQGATWRSSVATSATNQ